MDSIGQGTHSATPTWRRRLAGLGYKWSLVLITSFSVCAAVLLSYLLFVYFDVPENRILTGLFVATIVAIIVAPAASHVFIALLVELEASRLALARMATHDGLTDIFNRRYFDTCFAAESLRTVRVRQPMSVLMVDADEFKKINDRYGHATGDRVLQGIAAACAATLRPYDVLARYGGEEFVALLPSTTLEQACEIAERVRAAVESLTILSATDQPIPVTVSLGVGTLQPDDDANPETILLQADKALYEAKRSGRNRWCC
jgi:diguanylate cyclase (GGDEF)-like protein